MGVPRVGVRRRGVLPLITEPVVTSGMRRTSPPSRWVVGGEYWFESRRAVGLALSKRFDKPKGGDAAYYARPRLSAVAAV
jgi:hypothetical protein